MPPKREEKSENSDLKATFNLTLKTRHSEYARNETDPALRVQFDTSLWPKSKRSKSAEGEKLENLPNIFGTQCRSPAKSSDDSRSKSQSPVRSEASYQGRPSAPSISEDLENLTNSFCDVNMTAQPTFAVDVRQGSDEQGEKDGQLSRSSK